MNNNYYAVIDVKEGKEIKSYVYEYQGLRHVAKQELENIAKDIGGKISHFGVFKNIDRNKGMIKFSE